jgi:Prolipoprotein diacylglyceryltransferase
VGIYQQTKANDGGNGVYFLMGYGAFRFLVEFVRLPDAHLGYLAFNWLTMGQILSTPMILLGGFLMIKAYQKGS